MGKPPCQIRFYYLRKPSKKIRFLRWVDPSKKADPKADVIVPVSTKLLKKGKRDAEEVIQKQLSKKQKDVVANEAELKWKDIELKPEKKIVKKHESNEQNAFNLIEFRILSEDADVIVPVSTKLLKKGKGDAEEVTQKQLSKKQKDVVANEAELKPKKIELKAEKKIVKKHKSNERINAFNFMEFRILSQEVMPNGYMSKSTFTRTLFMGNLSDSIHYAAVKDFFKDIGKVYDVRLALNSAGYFEGFGYVKFASAEVARKAHAEKDSKKLSGCAVRLDLATDFYGNDHPTCLADAFAPVFPPRKDKRDAEEVIEKEVSSDESSSPDFKEEQAKAKILVPQSRTLRSKTLLMRNLSYAVDDDVVKAFFGDYGDILDFQFALHPDGYHLGQCLVKFETTEAAQKAFEEKNCQDLCGRDVRLYLAVKMGKNVQHIAVAPPSPRPRTLNPNYSVWDDPNSYERREAEFFYNFFLDEHLTPKESLRRLRVDDEGEEVGIAFEKWAEHYGLLYLFESRNQALLQEMFHNFLFNKKVIDCNNSENDELLKQEYGVHMGESDGFRRP